MAVSSSALTTRTNAKEALGISASDTSKDTFIDNCIDRATSLIEQITQRKLKARIYNNTTIFTLSGSDTIAAEDYVYFDGTPKSQGGQTCIDERGNGLFYLPAWPVRPAGETGITAFALAILSQRSNSGGETWDTTSYLENEHYVVDRLNGVLRLLAGTFRKGTRNYRVTMTAGYRVGSAQPYVPPDVEACCLELAKSLFRENRNLQSESIGSWSRSYNLAMEDPFLQGTLNAYRRFSL
jgi:hypothetical protein